MSDANFASLSSTLLARKGGAKPAMRPQSTVTGPIDGAAAAANLEDLGWNDMGEDRAPAPRPAAPAAAEASLIRRPAPVVALTPAPANEDGGDPTRPNQVRESLDRIASHLHQGAPRLAAAPAPVPAPAPAPRAGALRQGRRAAFTLRLDQRRHLMLRLACTVRGHSAQQIVTDALDELLATMPEIATLADQVQRDD